MMANNCNVRGKSKRYSNDDGMGTLIRALDSVCKEKDRAYEAHSNVDSVETFRVAMTDYIIDLEQRYNRMRNYDMGLPDAASAFKLLDTTACLDVRGNSWL